MGTLEQTRRGSWRGIPLRVLEAPSKGGRKISKKEFPGSNLQIVQDLGNKPRSFSIKALVAPDKDGEGKIVRSYEVVRAELLRALQLPGTGILVHPFEGTIPDLIVDSWDLKENFTELGAATIDISFERDSTDFITQPDETPSKAKDEEAADRTVQEAILEFELAIADLGIDVTAIANIPSLLDLVVNFAKSVAAAIGKAVKFIQQTVQPFVDVVTAIDAAARELLDAVDNLQAEILKVINLPQEIVRLVSNFVLRLDTIGAQAVNTFAALTDMFDFSDFNFSFTQTINASRSKKAENDLAVAVKTIVWSERLKVGSRIEPRTLEEIDRIQDDVEEQFSQIRPFLRGQALTAALNQRAVFFGRLDAKRITVRKLVDIETNLTTTRLISYQYYTDSTDGELLADINRSRELVTEGTIRILTA